MVRVYDPTRTDISNILIRKFQQLFYENQNRISQQIAIKAS